ncbi:MAG: histidine phosphatase family protein [Lysobacterales bacterium]
MNPIKPVRPLRRLQAPLLALLTVATAAQAAPDAVILVRHAEKASDAGKDPPLTAAGHERAQQLAAALHDAGVGTILVTPYRRNRDTAAPIASQRGITPQVIATDGDTGAHVAAVAAALRAASGTVLVVGHGNTVSRIIAAVGGPVLPDLCEDRYAQVFVLTGLGATPHLQRWQYGAVDPPAGKDCL